MTTNEDGGWTGEDHNWENGDFSQSSEDGEDEDRGIRIKSIVGISGAML